jgi:hypothetical protein
LVQNLMHLEFSLSFFLFLLCNFFEAVRQTISFPSTNFKEDTEHYMMG